MVKLVVVIIPDGHVVEIGQKVVLANSGAGAGSHQLTVQPIRLPRNTSKIFYDLNLTINQVRVHNQSTLETPVGARLSILARRWADLGAHPTIFA